MLPVLCVYHVHGSVVLPLLQVLLFLEAPRLARSFQHHALRCLFANLANHSFVSAFVLVCIDSSQVLV